MAGNRQVGHRPSPARPGRAARRAISPAARPPRRPPRARSSRRSARRRSRTPSASMPVTAVPVRTSTPSRSSCSRALPKARRHRRSTTFGDAFQQDHPGLGRIDVTEVARERVPGDLAPAPPPARRRSGRAPTITKVIQAPAARGICLPLRHLVRKQDAAADLQGVLDALQPRREWLPFVVAEVGVRRTRSP